MLVLKRSFQRYLINQNRTSIAWKSIWVSDLCITSKQRYLVQMVHFFWKEWGFIGEKRQNGLFETGIQSTSLFMNSQNLISGSLGGGS